MGSYCEPHVGKLPWRFSLDPRRAEATSHLDRVSWRPGSHAWLRDAWPLVTPPCN